jgi:Uma2 family endonuclease
VITGTSTAAAGDGGVIVHHSEQEWLSAVWNRSPLSCGAELRLLLPRLELMGMAIAIPRYTVQDLSSFPDDGNRYELLDGLLLVTPAPSLGHQAVVSRLVALLQPYLGSKAMVYTPGVVEIEPKVHLEPDILVVPASEPLSKWKDVEEWWLAVEVSGRGSRVYDRDFKFAAYSAVGVRDVWRVDLQHECVVVKTGPDDDAVYWDRFSWHPEELSDPVSVDVRSLFKGIQGVD